MIDLSFGLAFVREYFLHTGRLSNISVRLIRRYERAGNLQDLGAAINHAETAVKATPEDHPGRATRLSNLSCYLSFQYERAGNLEDLEAAITHAEAALKATPEDRPGRAIFLCNLGNNLSRRYKQTGNLEDLEAATTHAEASLKALPEDHPYRGKQLSYLGDILSSRYERSGNLQDLEAAIGSHFASWSTRTAPILIRLVGALSAAKMLVLNPSVKDQSRAYSLLHDAAHLMPLATSRSLERDDQQHILGQLTGLASLAAAVALEAGQLPLEALRLQELGRSVTNGQLIDYRSDISNLIEQHPTLAKDFDSLRQEIDSPFPFTGSSLDTSIDNQLQIQQAAIRRRKKVAKDLDNILHQIR